MIKKENHKKKENGRINGLKKAEKYEEIKKKIKKN